MRPKDADGMANSVDRDQEQSDLGLHCLHRPICLKTYVNITTQVGELPLILINAKTIQKVKR